MCIRDRGAWREFIQEENDDLNLNTLFPDSMGPLYTREDFNTSGSVEWGPSQQARREGEAEGRRLLEEGRTEDFVDGLQENIRRIFDYDWED